MIKLDIGTQELPTKDERLALLEAYKRVPHLAVDTESDPVTGRFLGISTAFEKYGMYFPVGHLEADANIDDETFKFLKDTIENHRLRVFQNAAHDLLELEDLGFSIFNKRFADTMVMAHMIDENLMSKGLDYLHKHYCNGVGKTRTQLMQGFIDTMGWSYVPVVLMDPYAKQDAIATSEVFLTLEPLYIEQFGELF